MAGRQPHVLWHNNVENTGVTEELVVGRCSGRGGAQQGGHDGARGHGHSYILLVFYAMANVKYIHKVTAFTPILIGRRLKPNSNVTTLSRLNARWLICLSVVASIRSVGVMLLRFSPHQLALLFLLPCCLLLQRL